MKIDSPFLIKPHAKVNLAKLSTSRHPHVADKDAADKLILKHREQLAALQEVFYASEKKALLLVLQGMDTAGKDGTISHIFSGVNPQGCDVASFKVPTPLEARHDFLWRCQAQVPARGMIGIFNRSHYEQVLSPRIHGSVSKKQAHSDMDDINAWEETLTNNDTLIFKFFLHISHKEQTERLQSRIDTPDKHWKLSPADFAERVFWPQYQTAYEDILQRTSTKTAPWFVIPADNKWYRNVAISQILVDVLTSLKLTYPKPAFDPAGMNLSKLDALTAAKRIKTIAEKADPGAGTATSGKKSK